MGDPTDKTPKEIRSHCPNCGPDTWAVIKAEFSHHEDGDPDGDIWLDTDYRILQCSGCKRPYVEKETLFSEDIYTQEDRLGNPETVADTTKSYFPAAEKRAAPSFLLDLKNAYLVSVVSETFGAFNSGLYIFVAVGARATVDVVAEVLGCDPSLTFNDKIAWLEEGGFLRGKQKDVITALVEAGHAANHRSWRPDEAQAEQILNTLEAFLHFCFVEVPAMSAVKAAVPAKQKATKP
jgi:hypothetical protein